MRRLIVVFAALALSGGAVHAQLATPFQGGPWAAGRSPMYSGNGFSQPILQDSGPAGGGGPGLGLSEQLLVARGSGLQNPPFVNAGSGPLGSNWCDYDGPITSAAGYHYICISPNSNGQQTIAVGSGGGATSAGLTLNVNGQSYPFPFNSAIAGAQVGGSLTGTLPNPTLAPGAALTNIGYTPLNKAGDTMAGPLVLPSTVTTPFSIPAAPFELVASTSDPDPVTTGALINFRPTLDLSLGHQVGFYIHPHAPLNTSNVNSFVNAADIAFDPIPAGVLGSIDGLDVNITTAQTASQVPAGDGNHAYGATLESDGGAEIRGSSYVLLNGPNAPATLKGSVVQLTNNFVPTANAQSTLVGFQAGVSGNTGGVAFSAIGNWAAGLQFNDVLIPFDGTHTYILADGYGTRPGIAGPYPSPQNHFNISFTPDSSIYGQEPHLWIDTSDLGVIATTNRNQAFAGTVGSAGFIAQGVAGFTGAATSNSCVVKNIVGGIITAATCS